MKYYIDFEFNEQLIQQYWWTFRIGKPYYFIDIISVGIVAENGAKFEALNKDANLKAAWNKVDDNGGYWLRENVLRKIYNKAVPGWQKNNFDFTLKTMEWIFATSGLDMRTMAYEINWFVKNQEHWLECEKKGAKINMTSFSQFSKDIHEALQTVNEDIELPALKMSNNVQFVAYYADYDWVCFCTLHGGMMKLPSTYPWYCYDLKQRMDELKKRFWAKNTEKYTYHVKGAEVAAQYTSIQEFPGYPKNTNEHDALADAEFDKALDEFLTWCENNLDGDN